METEVEGPDLHVPGGAAVPRPPRAPGAGLVQDDLVKECCLESRQERTLGEEVEPEKAGGSGLVSDDGDVTEGVSEEPRDEVVLGQTNLLVREQSLPGLHQLGSHLEIYRLKLNM